MLIKRDRNERGPTDAGWLNSQHSFSFGGYYDPAQMGYGPLRVINEDRVVPSAGFQTHPHSNMEIISYVLSGALAHKDSMGNGSTITAGEVQLMSAGSGVSHSEFNASNDEDVHFLQIWIVPNKSNTQPGYAQKRFDEADMHNRFHVVVAPDGAEGALAIKQDARLAIAKLESGATLNQTLADNRKYWIQVARGELSVNGETAKAGDGFAVDQETQLVLQAQAPAEVLLFDLPR